jgi:hypothetical protein
MADLDLVCFLEVASIVAVVLLDGHDGIISEASVRLGSDALTLTRMVTVLTMIARIRMIVVLTFLKTFRIWRK